MKQARDLKERFEEKVDHNGIQMPHMETQCYAWKVSYDKKWLYGWFRVGRKMRRAHQVSYELYNGEIPKGMCVCHHCDNPPCTRPDHLFLDTMAGNNSDRARKGRTRNGNTSKTHCKNGHLFDGDNLVILIDGSGRQYRACRQCRNAASSRRYNKNKEIINARRRSKHM